MASINYFVNENVFALNSGTEFSAIKRLELFHKQGLPAKLLTRNYNPQLSSDLKRVGLSHGDILNMYDYFQEVTNVPEKDLSVRYTEAIDKRAYHIEGIDANESLIKHAGKIIGKVLIAPATVGIVGSIEYYNDMNGIVARDIWDRRGFKSSTQYFHPDNTLGAQVFFDINGKPKLEITHMFINGVLNPTMFKLLDYKGKGWRFNTEEELFAFFLNELTKVDKIVFINDRPALSRAVASVQGAVGKWNFLHNAHSPNNQTIGASRQVVDYLNPIFTTLKDQFDGVIVATDEQRDEIKKFHHFKNVLSLPDTFADNLLPKTRKRKNKMIYLGRLAVEKNPIDALEILARARRTVKDLTLDIYGYASPAEIQETMIKCAEKLGIKEAVNFKGYQPPEVISEALDEAGVLISISESEAFGMNILEGLSHGVPVVAYRVKYGVTQLVENRKNGILVPYAALDSAAKGVVDVLTSDLTQAAYKKAQQFSEVSAWKRWENAKAQVGSIFMEERN